MTITGGGDDATESSEVRKIVRIMADARRTTHKIEMLVADL
jgi:hypothetical protein